MNKIVNSPEQKAGYSKKGPSLIFLIQIYLEEPLYEKCQIKKNLSSRCVAFRPLKFSSKYLRKISESTLIFQLNFIRANR